MGTSYGILGQALNPVIDTETEFIVVPADHEYTGTVRVCNTGNASAFYRIAHTPVSGAANIEDWDAYEVELGVGEVDDITMEMGPSETLRVQASSGNVAFKFSGMDIEVD